MVAKTKQRVGGGLGYLFAMGKTPAGERAVAAMLACAALALAGCATGGPAAVRRPSEAERLAQLVAEVAAAGVPLGDPLALPPEALARVADEIGGRGTAVDRLRRLAAWLSDAEGLAFRYDELRTVTAAEAWAGRGGDCLSYAHLFNSLARSLRVPMQYVRYRAPRGYQERGGQLLVVSHVASLYDRDRETVLVDLSGEELSPLRSDYQRLSDDEAAALHVSNLAMARLGRGEVAMAERLIRLMLARTPELPDLHNNLGAVLLHRRRYAEALAVLQAAIARFPSHVPLYVNAALAAQALGDSRLAEQLTARAEAPWTDPYVPFVRGAWLLDQGRTAEGVAILRGVVERSPDSATFQVMLARGLSELGQRKPALAAFSRARQIDPRHPMLLPLAQRLGLVPVEAKASPSASARSTPIASPTAAPRPTVNRTPPPSAP
jgi:tetratricopeptide (TPR) repeat protein